MLYSHTIRDKISKWRKRWSGFTEIQKRVLVFANVLLVDALILWTVGCFLDSTKVLQHITFGLVFAALVYLLHRWSMKKLSLLIFPRDSSADPVRMSVLAVGSVILWLLYLIPFTGLSKAFLSLSLFFSLANILERPFKDAYEGTMLGLLLFVSVIVTVIPSWVTGLFMLSITVPLIIFRYESASITQNAHGMDYHIGDVDLVEVPRRKRILISIAYFITGVVTSGVCLYFVILNMNPHWQVMAKSNREGITKYGFLRQHKSEVNLGALMVMTEEDVVASEPLKTISDVNRMVIKPNVCTMYSAGVQVCSTTNCLKKYMRADRKPRGICETCTSDMSYVVQNFCSKTEASVFYFRFPYSAKGKILSFGIREQAKIDEKKMLEHQFLPGKYLGDKVTPEMAAIIDDLVEPMVGLSGGIFDIMTEIPENMNSVNDLHLLDVNPFPLANFEEYVKPEHDFLDKIRLSLLYSRTLLLQLWIGVVNIFGGYQQNYLTLFGHLPSLFKRAWLCKNLKMLLGMP